MVSIVSLWLPIILSAALVFILSSIIHMVLPYHKSDFKMIPEEDKVMDEIGKFSIPPGEYIFPCATDSKVRNSQEFKNKLNKGPAGFLIIFASGGFDMGSSLVQWFIYCIIVEIFAAYISGRALAPGVDYLSVFRFAGVSAFIGYSLALIQDSIWYRKRWATTFKSMFDGLIYALFTGGIFGWLWPAV